MRVLISNDNRAQKLPLNYLNKTLFNKFEENFFMIFKFLVSKIVKGCIYETIRPMLRKFLNYNEQLQSTSKCDIAPIIVHILTSSRKKIYSYLRSIFRFTKLSTGPPSTPKNLPSVYLDFLKVIIIIIIQARGCN